MHIDQLREVLAERMARQDAAGPLLNGEPLEITDADAGSGAISADSAQVARISGTYRLMAAFALQASKKPLHIDSLATEFLGQYTKLLSESLPSSEDLLWDAYFAVVALYAVHFGSTIPSTIANLREFFEIFGGSPPPDRPKCTEDSFWPLVETLLVALEIDEALDVLNRGFQNVEVPPQVFDTVSELAHTLRAYPGRSGEDSSSSSSSPDRSQFWEFRRKILAVLDTANTLPLPWGPSIARVCALLTGRHESAARHWTHSVASRYAYLDPDQNEWPRYVQQVPAARPALDGDAPDWECAVARAMDGRIFSSLLNLQRLDTCSAVVLAEFYFCTNRLEQPFQSSPSLREYLGLVHALECLAVPGLVTTGVDILMNMETAYSREILAAALPELDLEGPETRDYVLDLTRQLDFPAARAKFQIKVAEYEVRNHNFVKALASYYSAGDFKGMRDTTWVAFEAMLLNGVAGAIAPETAQVLRAGPQAAASAGAGAGAGALPLPVQECVAPLAVLTTVLDGSLHSSDSHTVDYAVESLVSTGWVPPKYYPLIIACAEQVSSEATLAAMMRALEQWDSSCARLQGLDLIQKSRESASWARGIDPDYSNDEIVKMLRRKLSEAYV